MNAKWKGNAETAGDRAEAAIAYARRQAARALESADQEDQPTLPADSFPGYTITKELHRGGQGVIYLATQSSTQRTVAIKVLRGGATAGLVERARFERELRVLAQLRHPNIVGVHDGGRAGEQYYLVMDYIAGQRLDDFLTDAGSSVLDRLRLFKQVCEAVNAAHVRGIVHRDLKPGNILVDEHGQSHVLDFGLAKVLGQDEIGDQPTHGVTVTGQFVGSWPWASPEQAEGATSKIDVRTDVYALGLILYYMLTGQLPYEVSGSMREAVDTILNKEPARPSSLNRQIGGELDTIVLKCLSKDRERRYQSAGELARDVERYLSGEPIHAKSDSTWYVVSKMVQRHRAGAAVLATLFIGVALYGLTTTFLLQRARVAERQAQQSAADARKRFSQTHDAIAFVIGEVSKSLQGLTGATETRLKILNDAYDRLLPLVAERSDDPQLQADLARVHTDLGYLSLDLGKLERADFHMREALGIRTELASRSPSDVDAQAELSLALVRVGNVTDALGDRASTLEYFQQALAIDERLVREAPDNIHFLDDMMWSYGRLGDLELCWRRCARAREYYLKQLEIAEQIAEVDFGSVRSLRALRVAHVQLGYVANRLGHKTQAADHAHQGLGLSQQLVAREPDNFEYLLWLGKDSLALSERLLEVDSSEDVSALRQTAQEIITRLLEDEPHRMESYILLKHLHAVDARAARLQGDQPAALRHFGLQVDALRQLAPGNIEILAELVGALVNVGAYSAALGRHAEAEAAFAQAFELVPEALDKGHETPGLLRVYSRLLSIAEPASLRDLNGAVAVCERAVRLTNREDPDILCSLAELYLKVGRPNDAKATYEAALAVAEQGSWLCESIQKVLNAVSAERPLASTAEDPRQNATLENDPASQFELPP